MKKLYILLLAAVVLCGCNDKNKPVDPHGNDDPQGTEFVNGYRLDSTVIYVNDIASQKRVYAYSSGKKSGEFVYGWENSQWNQRAKTTYDKLDAKGRILQQTTYGNPPLWEASSRTTRTYNEAGLLTTEATETWDNNKWNTSLTYTYQYDSHGAMILCELVSYQAYMYKYNSYKRDYYYTGERKDSVYYYHLQGNDKNSLRTAEAEKTVYTQYDDAGRNTECFTYPVESHGAYIYMSGKEVKEYDAHGNITLHEKYMRFKGDQRLADNELELSSVRRVSYEYYPDNNIIRTESETNERFADTGENNPAKKETRCYYTKQ